MSPNVFSAFISIIQHFYQEKQPSKILEIGTTSKTLLSIPVFENSLKVGLNLEFKNISSELKKCSLVVGNSNKMNFQDGEFDCILTSSVLEHDKFFWKTIAEIYRVLSPGGLLVIGVPIYMKLPTDFKHTTLTFARHGYNYNADFYRFSEQAVREVFFDSYKVSDSILVRKYPNPYLVMSGVKHI